MSPGARNYTKTTRVGDWCDFAEQHIRLVSFGDLSWDIDGMFTNHIIAANAFAGLVALCPKGGAVITLYNSLGILLGSSTTIFLDDDTLLSMCWNDASDHLIVVTKNGAVRFFTNRGKEITDERRNVVNPVACCSTGSGVCIVLESKRVVVLDVEYSGRYDQLDAMLPLSFEFPPTALVAVSKDLSDSGKCEVLIAPYVSDPQEPSTLFRITFDKKSRVEDLRKKVDAGCIRRMAVSPDGTKLAVLSHDGSFYVGPSSGSELNFLFNTEVSALPVQLMWCGNGCITYLHLADQFPDADDPRTLLTACDPDNGENFTQIELATEAVLALEVDGIRVLSPDTYQMLQVVTPEAKRIYAIGSVETPALLVAAYDDYMLENAASVRLVHELTEDLEGLPDAIDDCVAAAGFEIDPEHQKRLLRIASFGKSFCPSYPTDNFVNMARRLRVLNAVRQPHVGMMMTMEQLMTLEGDRLTRRLVDGGHFHLAFCICEYLDLKPDKVMVEWAVAMVASSHDQDTLRERIVSKLKSHPGISFRTVSLEAARLGKRKLAVSLLAAEPSAASQVQCLMDIGEMDDALKRAVESLDSDLVFLVMTKLIGDRRPQAFQKLNETDISRDMMISFCRFSNDPTRRDLLLEYAVRHPDFNTHLAILQYLKHDESLQRKLPTIIPSSKNYLTEQQLKITATQSAEEKAKVEPDGQLKERALHLNMELIDDQTDFAADCKDVKFLNASVSQTLTLLIVHKKQDQADALAKRFHVSEKMYCWAKLRALIEIQDWPGIDKLGGISGKSKAPPIGYLPFVRLLLKAGRPEQARLFVPRISRIEERMEMYLLCGDWKGAAMDCKKSGEMGILEQLRERARGNARALEQIQEGANAKVADSSPFSNFFK